MSIKNVIGWDIGGANTKAVFLSTQNGALADLRVASEYFPIWKHPEELANVLLRLKEKLSGAAKPDLMGVTLTAELSDAFATKREGVNRVLSCVTEAFPDVSVSVLDVEGDLISVDSARAEPLRVVSANWAATGWMVSQLMRNCVVMDVGSTSTSIIPVVEGNVSTAGKNDLEKLMCGELVYTGALRTNVAAIVNSVPLRGGVARVSSELFAQSGDVHLVLGNIAAVDYTAETADGRGTNRAEALARLARVVCADTEMLSEEEIVQIATYVYAMQVEQIAEGLSQVIEGTKEKGQTEIPVVVAGLGRNFLGRKVAEKLFVEKILDLETLMRSDVAHAAPAAGVALKAATKLEGRSLKWML